MNLESIKKNNKKKFKEFLKSIPFENGKNYKIRVRTIFDFFEMYIPNFQTNDKFFKTFRKKFIDNYFDLSLRTCCTYLETNILGVEVTEFKISKQNIENLKTYLETNEEVNENKKFIEEEKQIFFEKLPYNSKELKSYKKSI